MLTCLRLRVVFQRVDHSGELALLQFMKSWLFPSWRVTQWHETCDFLLECPLHNGLIQPLTFRNAFTWLYLNSCKLMELISPECSFPSSSHQLQSSFIIIVYAIHCFNLSSHKSFWEFIWSGCLLESFKRGQILKFMTEEIVGDKDCAGYCIVREVEMPSLSFGNDPLCTETWCSLVSISNTDIFAQFPQLNQCWLG